MPSFARALAAALALSVAAAAALAQEPPPAPDPTGLLGALRRLPADTPLPAGLEALRDLGRGIAASGKTARLRELSLRPKTSVLRLGLDDALAAYDVKRAINAASPRLEADEGRVAPEKRGGVSVELKLTLREGAAPATPTAGAASGDQARADLGLHIQHTAARAQLVLDGFEKIGARSADPTLERVSYRLGLGTAPPDAVAAYLAALAAGWPGLEVDEITVQEAPAKGEDPPPAWKTTVLVSYSRPKVGPR